MGGDPQVAEFLTGLCIGIGLSAACGFRVFVPMLAMSIMGKLGAEGGGIDLVAGWEWMGSWPAIIAFGTATAVEIAGYYIPWVDNALDSVATPAAVVAGTIVTASAVGDVSPLVKWSLAIIAGGGSAGVVQGATVITRGLSTATTAGVGNPVVSTAEAGASISLVFLTVAIPVLALIVVALIVSYTIYLFHRWFLSKRAILATETTVPPAVPPTV